MTERTPEQIGREAGRAMADTMADAVDAVILKLTDAIASLRVEQAELRDELLTLKQEHDALERDHNEKYVEVRADIVSLLNP